MKNRIYFKRYLIYSLIVIIVFFSLMFLVNYKEYNTYKLNFNYKINVLLEKVKKKYPDVTLDELVEGLNSEVSYNVLREYGYDLEEDSLIGENDRVNLKYSVVKMILLLSAFGVLVFLFVRSKRCTDKEIDKIIRLIENINHRNYDLGIEDLSEDKLSILREEIYKTTVMLRENADNSLKDKIEIKNLLQDISHQLKTPLTSVKILLDNINDYPEMDSETRSDFIKKIKREIINITFLIENILKLSKFEVNTVSFVRKEVSVKGLIDEVVGNVASLCDLKGIKVEVVGCKGKMYCDCKWQVEALTNIVKNALEYSYDNSRVVISCESNKLYTGISVRDFGKGMDEEDLVNIFKRFYKGKNASNDSVGIGLSLAKAIIERDNGSVEVSSDKGVGTTFVIKYFK